MYGKPSGVLAKVPPHAQAGVKSTDGKSSRPQRARRVAFAVISASRRAGSDVGSSSPPTIARPSAVVRR
jgi:hypothetical protein